ncbi:hypothetical protein WHZ77_06045 [Bradyrhizobium sp. A5]|uniref:hypothetical protein n=1 Tax=Bradyrhizobium sp. A5 TaxID=3133696 RepID=UPI0032473451
MKGLFWVYALVLVCAGAITFSVSKQMGDEAKAAVEANGFTEVVQHGRAWWGCAKDDTVSDLFTAKAPNGKDVEVVACGGVFWKAFTVRIRKVW